MSDDVSSLDETSQLENIINQGDSWTRIKILRISVSEYVLLELGGPSWGWDGWKLVDGWDDSTCTRDSLHTVGRWMPVSSKYLSSF